MSYQQVLWQGFLCSIGVQELVSVSQEFLSPPVSAGERQRRDSPESPLPPPGAPAASTLLALCCAPPAQGPPSAGLNAALCIYVL